MKDFYFCKKIVYYFYNYKSAEAGLFIIYKYINEKPFITLVNGKKPLGVSELQEIWSGWA